MLLHKVFQYSAILLSNIYWGCLIVKGPNSYSGIYQVSILENYLEEEIDSTLDCENQFHDFKLLNHWPSTSYNSRHLINSQKKPHEESKQNKVIHFRKKYNSEYFIEYTNNIIIVQHKAKYRTIHFLRTKFIRTLSLNFGEILRTFLMLKLTRFLIVLKLKY